MPPAALAAVPAPLTTRWSACKAWQRRAWLRRLPSATAVRSGSQACGPLQTLCFGLNCCLNCLLALPADVQAAGVLLGYASAAVQPLDPLLTAMVHASKGDFQDQLARLKGMVVSRGLRG